MNTVLQFGKYKGKPLSEIPWYYLKWMLKEYKFKKGELKLKSDVQTALQKKSAFPC